MAPSFSVSAFFASLFTGRPNYYIGAWNRLTPADLKILKRLVTHRKPFKFYYKKNSNDTAQLGERFLAWNPQKYSCFVNSWCISYSISKSILANIISNGPSKRRRLWEQGWILAPFLRCNHKNLFHMTCVERFFVLLDRLGPLPHGVGSTKAVRCKVHGENNNALTQILKRLLWKQ